MAKDKTILVDFHTHTSWSDGHSTMPELVRAAKEKNLWEIVITDHDDCRALSTKNIAKNLMNLPGMREIAHNIYDFNGMKVSRGIELSCKDEERTVHIVGIYIDEPGDELKVKLAELRYKRIKRFRKIIKRLNRLKEIKEREIKFDVNKILMDIVSEGVPARLHAGVAISNAFEEQGLYITPREAMNKYLHSKSPAYISLNDPVFPSPKEGIETILSLHGLPVLPHLVEIRDAGFDILEKIKEYCDYGLIGFEAKSGRRTDSEEDTDDYSWVAPQIASDLRITIPEKFRDMSALNGRPLLPFFGKDYHGQYIPERKLGIEIKRRHLRNIQIAYNSITR